jgi:hypothetical protein
METFLTRFQWDSAKFPLRQPLPNIVDGISKVHASQQVYNIIIYHMGQKFHWIKIRQGLNGSYFLLRQNFAEFNFANNPIYPLGI